MYLTFYTSLHVIRFKIIANIILITSTENIKNLKTIYLQNYLTFILE